MTQLLELSPETEARLKAAAKERGVSPGALASQVVTDWTQSEPGAATSAATTGAPNGKSGAQTKAPGLSRLARVRALQENLSPLARQPFSAADLIEEVRAGRMQELEQTLGA